MKFCGVLLQTARNIRVWNSHSLFLNCYISSSLKQVSTKPYIFVKFSMVKYGSCFSSHLKISVILKCDIILKKGYCNTDDLVSTQILVMLLIRRIKFHSLITLAVVLSHKLFSSVCLNVACEYSRFSALWPLAVFGQERCLHPSDRNSILMM